MANTAQRSFAAGELAPAYYARTDLAKYVIGLRTARNFYVRREGGVSLRPGFEFVTELKDSTQPSRLVRFVFNISDTLQLEFGNQYIRFLQDGAPVTVSGAPAWSPSVPNAVADLVTHLGFNFYCVLPTGTVWSSLTAYNIGDLVESAGVTYQCILANTNQAPPNGTYWAVENVEPGTPAYWYQLTNNLYEIPTPYITAELAALGFVQSADVVSLVHVNHPPLDLERFSDTKWLLRAPTFAPAAAEPTGITVVGTTSVVDHTYQYAVTAVDDATGEESLADVQGGFHGWKDASKTDPHTVTWNAVPGASTYNVYLAVDKGNLGFVGTANSANLTFLNTGQVSIDPTTQPPQAFADFTGAGNYPGVVGYFQQRRFYAATLNNPSRLWGSRSGSYLNFNKSSPITDDGPIVFTLASDELDQIVHMLNLGKLLVGTEGAEWLCDGDANGILTPAQVNDRIGSYNGAAPLKPVKVDNTVLYVQSLGRKVLELKTNILYGYYTFQGSDLTLMSSHLFKGVTIVDWDFQEQPNYMVWVALSSGELLSLTYLPDQQLVAWTHHDTDGRVENVSVIPEHGEHAVYVIVNRTINGATRRYIERLAPLDLLDPIADPAFMDSFLEYDGRNAGVTAGNITLQLTGGPDWSYDLPITLFASAPYFTAAMIGDAIFLHGADGALLRATIAAFTNVQTVTVNPHTAVPLSLQGNVVTMWDHAVPAVSGLEHLEGKALSVFADGFVVASPNNADVALQCVVNAAGRITLDQPYAHIRAGLPYIGDLETLDLDTPEGPSLKDAKMAVTKVGLYVESTRGVWAGLAAPDRSGDPLDGLTEFKTREESDDMESPPPLLTKYMDAAVDGTFTRNGRVFVRQVDPVPCSILAAVPNGYLAEGR